MKEIRNKSFFRMQPAIIVLLAGVSNVFAHSSSEYKIREVAGGLAEPVGIARTRDGDVYIAEKGAGRIVKIQNGSPVPVIDTGFTVSRRTLPNWALSSRRNEEYWLKASLQEPGSISISSNGTLYVCEDVPGGRVLEFVPDESGNYTTANVLAIPWLEMEFHWRTVYAAQDGRLFLAGGVPGAQGLHFGTVVYRELDGNWWVVDYGPFMDFSSVYLSRMEDIILVCDRNKGNLVWWDSERHLPIGMVQQAWNEDAPAVSCGLTGDGAFVVAKDSFGGELGRLMRIDPVSGNVRAIAQDFQQFGEIETVFKDGTLYVTDSKAGKLLELTPLEDLINRDYLIQRSLDGYEMGEGFTPRVAPTFLKNFFSKVGVETLEQDSFGTEGKDVVSDRVAMSLSLREFSSKMPLVAGKIRTGGALGDVSSDPLDNIVFVVFFPGHAVKNDHYASPSFCYFSATRQSGKVEATRKLFSGLLSRERNEEGDWVQQSDEASISIPIATCSLEKDDNGMAVKLAFLGLGIYDDYYLHLTSGIKNKGEIIVERRDGGKELYEAVFTDIAKTGKESKDFVVAGFDPLQKSNVGWLNIGKWPVGSVMSTADGEPHKFSGITEETSALIERKEFEWRQERASKEKELDYTDLSTWGPTGDSAPLPEEVEEPDESAQNIQEGSGEDVQEPSVSGELTSPAESGQVEQ